MPCDLLCKHINYPSDDSIMIAKLVQMWKILPLRLGTPLALSNIAAWPGLGWVALVAVAQLSLVMG